MPATAALHSISCDIKFVLFKIRGLHQPKSWPTGVVKNKGEFFSCAGAYCSASITNSGFIKRQQI
jgi:hypothetical protein